MAFAARHVLDAGCGTGGWPSSWPAAGSRCSASTRPGHDRRGPAKAPQLPWHRRRPGRPGPAGALRRGGAGRERGALRAGRAAAPPRWPRCARHLATRRRLIAGFAAAAGLADPGRVRRAGARRPVWCWRTATPPGTRAPYQGRRAMRSRCTAARADAGQPRAAGDRGVEGGAHRSPTGPGRPVISSTCATAWCSSISSPLTTRAPAAAAAAANGVGHGA